MTESVDMSLEVLESFESLHKEDEIVYWYAHELSDWLGYTKFDTFKSVIKNARASADQAGFDGDKDFIKCEIDGLDTFKLTRFACLLSAMFADDKKKRVAYLKVALSKSQDYILSNNDMERIKERKKLSYSENLMEGVAKNHGLESKNFGLFKDSGYRGMYNMPLKALKRHKGVNDKDKIYDFMGFTELVANTYRTTLTKEHIESKNINTPKGMYKIAKDVGNKVRNDVRESVGLNPEDLEIEKDIKNITKGMKGVQESLNSN